MNAARVRVSAYGFPLVLNLPLWVESHGFLQLKIPGIRGSREESPVTTSLKDAVTEVPMLDGFSPLDFVPLDASPLVNILRRNN